MIVLDTNVLSETFRPQPDARVTWLESLAGEVAITVITLAELLAGARRLSDGRRKAVLGDQIQTALQPYRKTSAVLAFYDEAADHFAAILVGAEEAGSSISTADAEITALCRMHGATCATCNNSDFELSGVELIDPGVAGATSA